MELLGALNVVNLLMTTAMRGFERAKLVSNIVETRLGENRAYWTKEEIRILNDALRAARKEALEAVERLPDE